MFFNEKDLEKFEGRVTNALRDQIIGELENVGIITNIWRIGNSMQIIANSLFDPVDQRATYLDLNTEQDLVELFQLGNLVNAETIGNTYDLVPTGNKNTPARNFENIREFMEILDCVAERCNNDKESIILLYNYCAMFADLISRCYNTFEILGENEKFRAPLSGLTNNIASIEEDLRTGAIKKFDLESIDYYSNSEDIINICNLIERGLESKEIVELPIEEYLDELHNYLSYIPTDSQFALDLEAAFPSFAKMKNLYTQNKKTRSKFLLDKITQENYKNACKLIADSKILNSFTKLKEQENGYLVLNKIQRYDADMFLITNALSFSDSFYLLKKSILNADNLGIGSAFVAEVNKRNQDGITLNVKETLDDGSANARMQNLYDLYEWNMLESNYLRSNTELKNQQSAMHKRLREDVDINDMDCIRFAKQNLIHDSPEIKDLQAKGKLSNSKTHKRGKSCESEMKDVPDSGTGILKV